MKKGFENAPPNAMNRARRSASFSRRFRAEQNFELLYRVRTMVSMPGYDADCWPPSKQYEETQDTLPADKNCTRADNISWKRSANPIQCAKRDNDVKHDRWQY